MISYHEGKNSGTIAELHVIKQSAATFPVPPFLVDDLNYTDEITTTEDWTAFEFIPDSGRWEEVYNEEDESYSYTIEGVINKDRMAVTAGFKVKVPFKLLSLAKDNNDGLYRLLGSDEHFCFLSWSQVKERGLDQVNLYRVRITCTMGHPAVYYSGAFTSS